MMSRSRFCSLAAASALVLVSACKSTQAGDTNDDGTPRTSTGNATDSTTIRSDSAGTTGTPSTTPPSTPPSTPPTAR